MQIELEPAYRKYRISELDNRYCKVLNATAIASGYVGRDPQGGTSDGSFLVSSFSSLEMIKVLLLVLEKKMKKSYN